MARFEGITAGTSCAAKSSDCPSPLPVACWRTSKNGMPRHGPQLQHRAPALLGLGEGEGVERCRTRVGALLAKDLGTVPGTVRKTVSKLSPIGFLHHEDSTGWVFIVGFLDHNPIANINVGKSLLPFIEAIPRKAPFYKAFLDTLERSAERFPEGFLDRMRNGIANGSPNGMPTHDHDHEHDAGAVCGEAGSPDSIADAFTLYTDAAKRHGWSIPRKLDDDRRKALSRILKE